MELAISMPTVTIVVPTFNESGNVAELLRRLTAVREEAHIDEVIFVDDSTDNTPDVISNLADGELPVRLVHRSLDQRAGGLSGAVVTGIAAAKSPWVLVMDADLQHPPEDVPRLMKAADDPHVDTVVASRYCAGGRSAGLSNGMRRLVSTGSTRLAALLFPLRLRRCTDSMTGFFAVRRDAIDIGSLQPRGFKILLEILVRHRVRIVEVPFTFAQRLSGDSKASMREGLHFVVQLAQLRWQMWWATKRAREMVMFGGVGIANLLVDVGLFNLLLLGFRHEAAGAKAISTTVATIASYFMNRHWTWRDRARLGVHRELPVFALLSAIGLVLAEACLWVSHDLLGYTSALADNMAANGVGLMLGMVWRFLSFKKWVFTAPLVPAETGRDLDRRGGVPIEPTGARRSRELIDVD
jgi:dolichol-phosphate mannosyltransferase